MVNQNDVDINNQSKADVNMVIEILTRRIAELEKSLAVQISINANSKKEKNAKK